MKLNTEMLLEQLDILENVVWSNEKEFLEALFPDFHYNDMARFSVSKDVCEVVMLMEDGSHWSSSVKTDEVLEWALSYPKPS